MSESRKKEVNILNEIKLPNLAGDTLENILIMAPLLDEKGQDKVFGLMCGLVSSVKTVEESSNKKAG